MVSTRKAADACARGEAITGVVDFVLEAEAAARGEQIVDSLRQQIYGPRSKVLAVLAAEKAANKTRPVLNAVLNAGAGNAPTLARSRLRARAEQMDARSATAAKKGTLG